MKKLVVLLLVGALLCLTGCGWFKDKNDSSLEVSDICDIANKVVPTKVISEVNLVTTKGHSLKGYYTTVTDGADAIFTFRYQRFATPEESIESGNSDMILSYEGTINYHDGVYYGDEELWVPGTGTAFDLKFHIDESLLKEATVAEDGYTLNAKVSKENLAKLIGTDLNATGDADISIVTNGKNLTMVNVSCATSAGRMVVRTSFTYNAQDLFTDSETEQ